MLFAGDVQPEPQRKDGMKTYHYVIAKGGLLGRRCRLDEMLRSKDLYVRERDDVYEEVEIINEATPAESQNFPAEERETSTMR